MLTKINPIPPSISHTVGMSDTHPSLHYWLPISIAPEDCDLKLGAIDKDGIRPLAYPCRKRQAVWFNVWANEPVLIHPTHWRTWRS